ncbi:nucleotidyltransferase domain-containing protein [Microtetraspora sp. NBRC 13810]|uniref:nucleotidyltransferase domain-containing protein n=1 Tax=Microtetraspora sp. NBRC 13810 TaxID=3030990 RepID=UPI00255231D1|nr:nucleotidyltransferase domain-containing protein [Microtetraspora sp. NBRC 13810]
MSHDVAGALVERFVIDIARAVPVIAVWVHGSLATGDFQLGRSDFDLLAVVAGEVDAVRRREIRRVHEALAADFPVAAKLHCSYLNRDRLADVGVEHPTWAFEELFDRTVSPVIRRELLTDGVALIGPPPTGLVPAVSDQELTRFIRTELDGYWRRVAGRRRLWLRDMWVDAGPLSLARATVTLQGGGMISKREAFPVLLKLGAPAEMVSDIHDRRYGTPRALSPAWRLRRAGLARAFMLDGIDRALALP